jgi:predicted nucleic acid-binding protein
VLVTLGDTGPLVALIEADDPDRALCKATLARMPDAPLIVTWPCIAEAMYLLRKKKKGVEAQDELWDFVANDPIEPHINGPDMWDRMRGLMRRYRDTPMDLADASIVSAAERLGTRRVFTLDRHFHVYRIDDQHNFEAV